MKVTLTHIGIVSLGRLMAIWGFIITEITVILLSLLTLLVGFLESNPNATVIQGFKAGLVGAGMLFVIGSIAAVIEAIIMFIVGAITAIIYDIVIKVGGGIDLDFKERK